jgi:hypothetical protein
MQYIYISYPDRVVPVVSPESIFDIDDIGVFFEIVVEDFASCIYGCVGTIGYIYPCLSSSRISHIIRDKYDIRSITICSPIRYHRKVIREYDDRWHILSIPIYDIWSDDCIMCDMDVSFSYLQRCHYGIVELIILFSLESREDRSREKYAQYSMDR